MIITIIIHYFILFYTYVVIYDTYDIIYVINNFMRATESFYFDVYYANI